MLTMHIRPGAVARQWRWIGSAFTDGISTVSPYQHPNLEQFLITDGTRTLMSVRERRAAGLRPPVFTQVRPDEYDQARRLAAAWTLDHHLVEVSPSGVSVTAGIWGTAPVYLTSPEPGVLYGCWDYAFVARQVPDPKICRATLSRALSWWNRYSHSTPVEQVKMLTAGSTALLTPAGLFLTYPAPAEHSLPRELSAGADPVAGLDMVLEHVIAQRWLEPGSVAVELSGGQDSAAIAATLGDMFPGAVTTCALLLPGPAGQQQMRRRAQMREHMKLGGADITVEAAMFPPFHPDGDRARGELVLPTAEWYSEAFAVLLDEVAASGARTVFTGVGGDEMLSLRPGEAERPLDVDCQHPHWLTPQTLALLAEPETDLSPATAINEVTLMSFASAPMQYLRRGLWPVSPMAAPEAITFGEWLPLEWRRRKRLLRERLLRRGMSEEVARPPLRENFTPVMDACLRNWGLDHLRAAAAPDSYVVSQGYVDPDQLLLACDKRAAHGAEDGDHPLMRVVSVEWFLKALFS